MLALLEEGEVSVLSWRAVAIMVISLKFARFKGNHRPGLRPRAAPCFMDNQRDLREITGNEHVQRKSDRRRRRRRVFAREHLQNKNRHSVHGDFP